VTQDRQPRTGFELRTERLLLRPFRAEDEGALLRLWNEPEVRRFLWDGQPVSMETVRGQIEWSVASFEERGFGHFTVHLGAVPGFIGFAGLRPIGTLPEVELLYALHPGYWGRGLATEAARAVLRFGFTEAGLAEILAGSDPPNVASFRVMQRLGMTFLRNTEIGGRPARYYRITREAFLG
jgi:RimJ/RimL family protein N-acetyltransferase